VIWQSGITEDDRSVPPGVPKVNDVRNVVCPMDTNGGSPILKVIDVTVTPEKQEGDER
jgi:hypothetical protein